MNVNLHKNKLLIFTILVLVTLGIAYLLRFDIYEHDDFSQSFFYTNNLWDIIKTADHGRYFSWIYMKIVVHGSSVLFNTHPNDNLFIKFVVGFNISMIILAMSLLFSRPFKQKLSPLLVLISTFTLFYLFTIDSLFTIYSTQIWRYNQHFAYQSNFFFYLLIWGIIARYFIQGEMPLRKHLVANSFWALFLGITAHFNILSSIATILFLFLYAIIRFYIQDKSLRSIFSKLWKLGRDVYIPLVSFVVGNVLYFSAPNFRELLEIRNTYKEGNRYIEALKNLPDFLPDWLFAVFLEKSAFFLVASLFACICYICWLCYKKLIDDQGKAIRVIVLSVSLVLGVAFFNGTLLLSGRSMYDSGLYWTHSDDLILITRMIELAALWIAVGYILSLNLKEHSLETYWLTIKTRINPVYILLSISAILFLVKIPAYVDLYNSLKKNRSNWYQTEKIYRLYSLLGETAILPANNEKHGGEFWHNQFYESTPTKPISWTGEAYILRNYPTIYYKDLKYAKESLENYKFDQTNKPFNNSNSDQTDRYVFYILTNSNIAIQLFEEKGGAITSEELSYPLFNKLFDEKFILNKRD
ncbi:MAG: hypothetical protein ACRC9L_00975 [Brevinema sp.]